ncbi:MAG: GFA family protein [Alphaproteobacteria bacterium]|nr:GFA family protein [Alphaproteobacteria bacterium]
MPASAFVTFEITGSFEAFFLCHCARCRKDTGSAHAANLFSSSATLEWLSGADRVKTYRVPDTRHENPSVPTAARRCRALQMDGTLLVVPAGSLDSAFDMRPSAHICCRQSCGVGRDLESVPVSTAFPAERGTAGAGYPLRPARASPCATNRSMTCA